MMININYSGNTQPKNNVESCLHGKSKYLLIVSAISLVAGVILMALGAANVFGSSGFTASLAAGGALLCIAIGSLIWIAVSYCKNRAQVSSDLNRADRKINIQDNQTSQKTAQQTSKIKVDSVFQKKWEEAGLDLSEIQPFLEACMGHGLNAEDIAKNIIDIRCVRKEEPHPLGIHKSREIIVNSLIADGQGITINTRYGETKNAKGLIVMKVGPSFGFKRKNS